MLNNKKHALTAQLSPVVVQQRSAVRCRAAPCLALRCCGVLRCASFEHRAVPGIMRYSVPTGMYDVRVYKSYFRVLHLIVSLGPLCSKITPMLAIRT